MDRLSFRRHLRRNQSEAEAMFWKKLRGRRFHGLKFKRQVSIGKYIADFVCEHEKLIVELDGYQHGDNIAYDDARTRALQEFGYRIVRIRNEDIYADMGDVLEGLKLMVGQR